MTRERGILFSAPMVRALLAGRKTQTRRVVKLASLRESTMTPYEWELTENDGRITAYTTPQLVEAKSPYGGAGDRLWVRETFTHVTGNGIRVHYRADGEPTDRDGNTLSTEPGLRRWMPSIFMPRKESRITLNILHVSIQRLMSITDEDARAEGVTPFVHDPEGDCWTARPDVHRSAFEHLWGDINGWIGPKSWASNPLVWVVKFSRVANP